MNKKGFLSDVILAVVFFIIFLTLLVQTVSYDSESSKIQKEILTLQSIENEILHTKLYVRYFQMQRFNFLEDFVREEKDLSCGLNVIYEFTSQSRRSCYLELFDNFILYVQPQMSVNSMFFSAQFSDDFTQTTIISKGRHTQSFRNAKPIIQYDRSDLIEVQIPTPQAVISYLDRLTNLSQIHEELFTCIEQTDNLSQLNCDLQSHSLSIELHSDFSGLIELIDMQTKLRAKKEIILSESNREMLPIQLN